MSSFRRRLMMAQGGGSAEGIPSTEAVVGDVCMYGINEGKLIIVNDWDASKYPIDKYPPIGVVVVPGSHRHYADGKCAIISLNEMNCDTPQTGSNKYTYIRWGVTGVDIASLPNLNKVPCIGNGTYVGANVNGQADSAYLPSDDTSFNAVSNPYDNKTKYYNRDLTDYHIPSPYNNDGTFNPNYSLIVSPSSTANCLADFDGYNNTKKILEVRGSRDYSTWKPVRDQEADYPAASCCDMYSTVGTNQGIWYLPAAGELGYVCVRIRTINNMIKKIKSAGATNATTVSLSVYWSSSECNNELACNIWFSNGATPYSSGKSGTVYVRAFCLV